MHTKGISLAAFVLITFCLSALTYSIIARASKLDPTYSHSEHNHDHGMSSERDDKKRFRTLAPLGGSRLTSPDAVDRYVEQQMHDKHIPGAVVVVLRNGKIIKQRAFGLANIELNVPAKLDDVYPIASITKVFAATGIFLLIQDGKLHLDG